MKTTHRNYSEENRDFQRLARYFTSNPVSRRTHTTSCLGRLVDWKYALYENKHAYPSFCEENAHLWFDAFGKLAGFEADIERVCTHGAFRQCGFARAAIQECLRRLKDMGLHNAYITGYSEKAIALYGSLGAMDEVKSYFCELPT